MQKESKGSVVNAIFPEHADHALDPDALTNEVLRLSQLQRALQKSQAAHLHKPQESSENSSGGSQEASPAASPTRGKPKPAPKPAPTPVAESNAVEELGQPDWSVHFSATPLNVMEEAARKSMMRGIQRPPVWDEWRDDMRAEGKEMAADWGKRDKNTRIVEQIATDLVVPTIKEAKPKSRSLWNDEIA